MGSNHDLEESRMEKAFIASNEQRNSNDYPKVAEDEAVNGLR
jgi:hypothetical protein